MRNNLNLKKKTLGNWGEQQAKEILEANGLTIIEQNFRTPYGEIDLLAKDGAEFVFIEVKTRSSLHFGYPEVSVSKKKIQHMKSAAFNYLQESNKMDAQWRIDVISINKDHDGSIKYEWFKNAVSDG